MFFGSQITFVICVKLKIATQQGVGYSLVYCTHAKLYPRYTFAAIKIPGTPVRTCFPNAINYFS